MAEQYIIPSHISELIHDEDGFAIRMSSGTAIDISHAVYCLLLDKLQFRNDNTMMKPFKVSM